jgi:hypothetical protein
VPRRRGNPKWTTGQFRPIPKLPTAFEEQVQKLGLNDQTWATSEALQRWCESNKNRRYIPEWLLKQWRIFVDAELNG